jgi:hypothetical protein
MAGLMMTAIALACEARAASVTGPVAAVEPAVGARTETAATSFEGVVSFINGVAAAVSTAGAKATWDDVRKQALELSGKQRGGRPETLRFCEPELKLCNNGVVWRTGTGSRMFLRQAEDSNGKPLEREICEINSFGDVRVCIDWDTKIKHRDVKDLKGHWYQVADR